MITVPERDCLKTVDSQMARSTVSVSPEIKDDVAALLWKFNMSVKTAKSKIMDSGDVPKSAAPSGPSNLSAAARQRQKRVKKNRARTLNRWKRKIREQHANPVIEDTKQTVKEARARISSTLTSAFKLARSNSPLDAKQLAGIGHRLVGLFRGRYRKLSKKILQRYLPEQ